jgi:hypothetical protein
MGFYSGLLIGGGVGVFIGFVFCCLFAAASHRPEIGMDDDDAASRRM